MPGPYDHIPSSELGKLIKAKYRGEFDDVPDQELGDSAKTRFAYKGATMPPPALQTQPTANHPTTPESADTIRIQLQQLKVGKRKAVMLPKGTPATFSARQFNARRLDTRAGVFFYNPQMITGPQILQAISNNELPGILGDVNLGYGAPDKSELMPPIRTITARSSQGVPIQDVATDEQHKSEALQAAQSVTPAGGSIEDRTADDAIAERVAAGSDESSAGEVPHTEIPDAMTRPQKRMKFRKAKRLGLVK